MQRSSRPEMFCKSIVLKNFTKFTRKHLRQNLFLNKVTGLSRSINKETLAQAFSREFSEKIRERPKEGHYFRIKLHRRFLTGSYTYVDRFITILIGFQADWETLTFRCTCFVKLQAVSTQNDLRKINISSFWVTNASRSCMEKKSWS